MPFWKRLKQRILSKLSCLRHANGKLNILKITAIAFPVIFIIIFELFRHFIFGETLSPLASGVSGFLAVILAAFFYINIFNLMDKAQEENIQRNHELSILHEVALAISESLNLNVLLAKTMEKLVQVTGADSVELFLINEKNRELSYTLHAGKSKEIFKPDSSSLINDELIGEVAGSNKPIIVEDLKTSGKTFTTVLPVVESRSLAVIPLKSRGGIVGVCTLLSHRPGHFTLNETRLFTEIGNQIGVAIENARLFEKVQATAIVEERERIAKELHDGLAQVLGYVITKSQATRQILNKMTVATNYLVELENVAHDLYTDTREDILGLRTTISGNEDMISALRNYMTHFSQMYGIKTTLEVGDEIIPRLPPKAELQAIRIVQEALSNIRKHAEATNATVKVAASENEVTLTIEDNGKGFDIQNLAKDNYATFGLKTIKERAESIHSRVDIVSKPDFGTKVTLTIPLNLPKPPAKQDEEIESTDS